MKNKSLLILQSNYIPWIGYFDLINHVDEFIIYDTVQYTRRDWRNRNKILFQDKEKWLTIPVQSKGNYTARINQIDISPDFTFLQHLDAIKAAYKSYPYFKEIFPLLQKLYNHLDSFTKLSEVNAFSITQICHWLGIETSIVRSENFSTNKTKEEALIDICLQSGAKSYLTGPSGMNYINPISFKEAGITLKVFKYPDYASELRQSNAGLSIIHILMQTGLERLKLILNKLNQNVK